jgi:hypothetical protein
LCRNTCQGHTKALLFVRSDTRLAETTHPPTNTHALAATHAPQRHTRTHSRTAGSVTGIVDWDESFYDMLQVRGVAVLAP